MKKHSKIVEQSIEEFLQSTRINKEGVKYNLFDSKYRKSDLVYLKDFFMGVYEGLTAGLDKDEKREVFGHMLLTFEKIQSFRIDEKDENVRPMQFTVEDMRSTHNGQLDDHGGVTRAKYFDGISILVPALKTEILYNLKNKKNQSIEGTQTALHEFVHAMSVWTEVLFRKEGLFKKTTDFEYVSGIRPNSMQKGIFDDLNEGFTEYVTRKTLNNIFRNSKYKDKIQKREENRIKLVEEILNLFGEEKGKITLMYITGRGSEILDKFHQVKKSNGESLYEFLYKNYQNKHRGISNLRDENHPGYLQDVEVFEEIKKALQDFTYINEQDKEIE